jgi:hypothetical protein
MSEMLKYKPARDNNGTVIIDNNSQAVEHYYRGGGENVHLGQKTVAAIQNSTDINKARNNLRNGTTTSPAHPKNRQDGTISKLAINMETESVETFHLGSMTLDYSTKCNPKQCTTTFTVDDKGFVDPNTLGEYLNKALNKVGLNIKSLTPDNKGNNLEAGGKPYDYAPVQWSETYTNPGYKTDDSGSPLPMKK